jgi:DNA polymerase elongation subunit (family B)
MVVFQALTWEAKDSEDGDDEQDHIVSIFGRCEDGKSVCVSTSFRPYFFIKLPKGATEAYVKILFEKIKKACPRVKSYSITKSKDLWGFQNSEKSPFMKLDFATLADMKMCDSKLRYPLKDETYPVKVYESNLEPMLRLMHRSGIQSTGWIEAGDSCVPSNIAKTDIDIFCTNWKDLKPVARDDIAPFIIASFDIETNSSTGKFPDADIEADACFQIAITLKRQGTSEIYDKTCLCYKKTSPREDCTIVSFDTEKDLLMGFRNYVNKHDIDVMTGWNIFGFDLEYIFKRAIINRCPYEFFGLGKFKDQACTMVYKKLSSSALGDNTLKLLPMSGRFIFDLFHEVKREKKLDSYSLNFVAKTFLGDQKIDMSPKEMFKRFREEDPDKLSEVAEYCVKDTLLPHQLLDKLCMFTNLVEMAKATWVPLCYLSERGQQIKVFSQLTRKARELGFMVPTIRYGKIVSDPYEGATVLSAQTGAYYTPITALDFEGLYPSIMVAHNLCYSTLVMDPKYDGLPGVTYESFTIGEKTYKFAQDVPSLLPAILVELKAFRKKAKRDMAEATTPQMKKVYDGKQLAYKISMNSVYGFTGAGKGILPCVPIASTVTCKGRGMIEETKNYVEANFPGAKVRYGDSVTEDTALLLRVDGIVTVKRIDELKGSEWVIDDHGKEFSKLYGVETWTEKGWTPVCNVIRHATDKKIYKILSHTGCVSVTEDHSLLTPDSDMIQPKNVTIGTELLHSFPKTWKVVSMMTEARARLYGFFLGDGSCGYYENCDKSSWTLNNADRLLLDVYSRIISDEYPEYEPVIYDTLESSGVYKLNVRGKVKKLALEFRKLFYTDARNKKVPDCIFTETNAVKEAFIQGLYDADGDKVGPGTRIDQKSQVTSLGIYTVLKSLDYNVSINTRTDKTKIYRITFSKSTFRKNPNVIKKIEKVEGYTGMVYDLTTENHHFHAGVGSLIVHNTDSVMVEFDVQGRTGKEAIEYSWKLGEEAAKQCTALFKQPNNLELEKVYCPYFLYSKKRYAAKLWTQDKSGEMKMNYIDIKGLQVVRRDNTPFVRETCKELLDVILESKNPEGAIELARKRAVELLDGRVPNDKLVLSQKLADSYTGRFEDAEGNKTKRRVGTDSDDVDHINLPHVNVVRKMREREPGSEPQSGDRVQFLLTDTGDPGAKQFEKAEDPAFVLANRVPLDYNYYFTNKFMNPVCDLLEPIVEKDKVFEDLIPKKQRRVSKKDPKQPSIADMFAKKKV